MANEINGQDQITEDEIKKGVSILEKISRIKNVPQEIFDNFQKAFGGTSLEVVPLNVDDDGKLSVFLIKRPKGDTYWPNELHVPGTMVFPWDLFKYYIKNGFSKPFDRLKVKEIKEIEDKNVNPVGTLYLNTRRGAETAFVHLVVVDKDLAGGAFYAIENLPENVISHQLPIIREAVLDFVGSVKSGHFSRKDIDPQKADYMVKQVHNILHTKYEN